MGSDRTADVVVVGSGVVGAATAAAIARRGASVVVLDKEDGPAREASGRAQGSLRVQGRHASEIPMALEALTGWREAIDDDPTHDIEWSAGGNLYVQTRAGERPILDRLVASARAAGLAGVEYLDSAQVRDAVPAMTGPVLGGMFSPVDAQCQPAKATELFVRRARRAGAEFRFRTKATRVITEADRVAAVETSAGTVSTRSVLIAAGVWTSYLVSTVGLRIPIMPVCLSEAETSPLPPLFAPTLRAFGFGARQRPNGRIVISGGLNAKVSRHASLYDLHGLRFWLPRAATFRRTLRMRLSGRRIAAEVKARDSLSTTLVPDTSPEPAPLRRELDGALARLTMAVPSTAAAIIERRWGGLVDMTPDGLPIIDRAGPDGLTVIAGLSGHGLALAPVLGEIAAELALDGRSTRPIDEFTIERFAGRVPSPEIMI